MPDPVQEEFREYLRELAKLLDFYLQHRFGRRIGFALLLFEFNDFEGGRVNYISNAQRDTMIAAIKEWLARQEGRYIKQDESKKHS